MDQQADQQIARQTRIHIHRVYVGLAQAAITINVATS